MSTKLYSHARRAAIVLGVCAAAFAPQRSAFAADERELVEMPAMMQTHMLGNMRDHLLALNEIFGFVGAGQMEQAAEVAEQRLGLSSLDDHGAANMAPMMPEAMRNIGTSMHKAASRFAIQAQDAGASQSAEDLKHLFSSLKAVTDNCNACHAAYRIR